MGRPTNSIRDEVFANHNFTDAQKHRVHALFEALHPEAHGAFLKWLGIPAAEIRAIRAASR